MSINLLMTAVAAHPRPFLAVVSSTLHMELQHAGALAVARHPVTIPSDPKYGALIDRWLESEGIDPNAPAPASDPFLRAHPRVHVRLDSEYGLSLAATGAGSFKSY